MGKYGTDSMLIYCLINKEAHMHQWTYDNLKTGDAELLIQNLKDFCNAHKIAFQALRGGYYE